MNPSPFEPCAAGSAGASGGSPQIPRRRLLAELLAPLALLGPVGWYLQLDTGQWLLAAGLVASLLTLLWRTVDAHPHARFGPANQITLLRVGLACVLVAAVPGLHAPTWTLAAIAGLAALLDAVDGWCARRTRLGSAFGARFDLESDAFLVLVLALLLWRLGLAGAWVLLSGLMRYAFVAAARAWPWLAAPLPASTRRRAVCAVQVAILWACLLPHLPHALTAAMAGVGVAALAWSFAIDVAWLRRTHVAGRATTARARGAR